MKSTKGSTTKAKTTPKASSKKKPTGAPAKKKSSTNLNSRNRLETLNKAKNAKTAKAKPKPKPKSRSTKKPTTPRTATKKANTTKKTTKRASTSSIAAKQGNIKDKKPGIIKREKNLEKGKWEKGQSGNPKGRPKKVLTRFSQYGYSKQEVRDTFAALAGMTTKELDEIITDVESTVLEVLAAREFKRSTKKKGGYSSSAKNMVEMFADKAVQHKVLEIDANLKHHNLGNDELDEKIAKLSAKIAKDSPKKKPKPKK